METQKQVKQHSGNPRSYSVDDNSLDSLRKCTSLLRAHGHSISGSIIVRRALRVYWKHLTLLETRKQMEQELIETARASKGVI